MENSISWFHIRAWFGFSHVPWNIWDVIRQQGTGNLSDRKPKAFCFLKVGCKRRGTVFTWPSRIALTFCEQIYQTGEQEATSRRNCRPLCKSLAFQAARLNAQRPAVTIVIVVVVFDPTPWRGAPTRRWEVPLFVWRLSEMWTSPPLFNNGLKGCSPSAIPLHIQHMQYEVAFFCRLTILQWTQLTEGCLWSCFPRKSFAIMSSSPETRRAASWRFWIVAKLSQFGNRLQLVCLFIACERIGLAHNEHDSTRYETQDSSSAWNVISGHCCDCDLEHAFGEIPLADKTLTR